MVPKNRKSLPPVHPGEILREDLMKPLGLSINRLASDLRVPVTRIREIVHRRPSILELARMVSAGQIAKDVHPRQAA
jgi:addiction module HigA family antidote